MESLICLLVERTDDIDTRTQECVESVMCLQVERTNGFDTTQECVESQIGLVAERTDGRIQECVEESDRSAYGED